MAWCESQHRIDYILAMATNSQLKLRASDIIEKVNADYNERLKPVTQLMETLFSPDEELEEVGQLVPESTWYRSLCYKTQKSWSRSRRVVTKVCYGNKGAKMRHVVTSFPASKITPSKLYTDKYCPVMLRWKIGLKNNNLIYLLTELRHRHLRVINSDFGFLQWLMF